MSQLISLADIEAAGRRIEGTAIRTPLVQLNGRIWLKDESAQPIGSFKLRGAFNMVAQLSAAELARGVITYSSGNHAQGVAYAARALEAKAVIVMPSTTPPNKMAKTRALGAEIVIVGPASLERKAKAEELAAEHGYVIVPPYDDERIIAGQATCGIEILEQLGWNKDSRTEDALLLVPVSGGGLLSGISTGVKLLCEANAWAAPQVWAAEPELAADATESFRTGKLVEWDAAKTTRTLADGLRTQSLGKRNFAHILRFTDGFVNVSEAELREAMQVIMAKTSIVPEPSGAVSVAAALFHAAELPGTGKIVAVISGGNLEPDLRAELENEQHETHV